MANFCRQQSPREIIMVRPSAFGFDEETSASNAFQHKEVHLSKHQVQQKVLDEFDNVVEILRRERVTVIVFNDSPHPRKPNAIFPNNWFSTHPDGKVVLYPMLATTRRKERRLDIIQYLKDAHKVTEVVDLSKYEETGQFLEGTGSIVFDHLLGKAYACHSSRTNADVLKRLCDTLNYEAVTFRATDDHGIDIYHTNVMMWIGTTVAAICAQIIHDEKERDFVVNILKSTGREIVFLSLDELQCFAGNCLELITRDDKRILAISKRCLEGLTKANKDKLSRHVQLVPCSVDTIEHVGGGGIRCMIAGVHLTHL